MINYNINTKKEKKSKTLFHSPEWVGIFLIWLIDEILIKMVNLCENMFEKKITKMIPSISFDWISLIIGRIGKTPMNCSFISIVWLFFIFYLLLERSISCKEFIISIYLTQSPIAVCSDWCIRIISVLPTSRNAWIYQTKNKK